MTLHLGKVKPGETLYIPFDTFAGSTGASVTMSGLAVTDIEIYKNGSVTQRASDTGYTLLDTDGIDFDGLTGIHGFSIDLSSNATADFFTAGGFYWVVVSAITVDSQTVSFVAATFRIGYEGALLDTTIATLASQTSFTLTAGPAEDDALNGCVLVIHDIASAVQMGKAIILDYTGSTKTVTLLAGVTFTAAAGDNVSVLPPALQPSAWGAVEVVQTGDSFARIGATGSGLTTLATQASVNTIDDFLDTEVAAIKAKTDNLPSDPADASDIASSFSTVNTKLDTIDDFLDTEIAAIISTLGTPAGASISADILTLDNLVDDLESRVGTPSNLGGGATIAANLSDIEAQTDDIGVAGAGLTALATQASVDTIDNLLDTEIAAITASLQGLVLVKGTIGATGNTTTALHLDGLTYGDDEINNYLLVIFDVSAGEYHSRWIEDWADTGDLATVATLPFTPQASTDTYWLLPVRQDVTGGSGLDAAGVRAAVGLASANLDTQLSGIQSDTNDIQTRIPAALVSGRMDASVGAMAANTLTATAIAADAITAAKIATGAIDADAIAADAVTEIQSGLSTVTTAQVNAEVDTALADVGLTTTITGRIDAAISTRATPAQVNTEVDTALADVRLDELIAADSDIDGAAPPAVGSVVHELMSKTAGSFTYDQTTDALEALRDRGDAAWATATGFSTLDAADVRSAVGLASANLDTQLDAIDNFLDTEVAAIKAKTDNLPASPAAAGDQMALTTAAIDAILDEVVEGSYTMRQFLRLFAAALGGELSGAATTTITIRDASDTKARITATVDADGNRSAITLDLT